MSRLTQLTLGCSRKVSVNYGSREYHAGATVDVEAGEDVAEVSARVYEQLRAMIEDQHRKDGTEVAVLERQQDRVLIDEGEHVLKLVDVKIERIKSSYPDGKSKDGMADVLIWEFTSDQEDERGVAQELRLLTPPAISAKNKTGRIAKMLSPGIDPDVDEFDPDDFIGRRFRAFIAHQETSGGKTIAWPASMKPYKNGASSNGNGNGNGAKRKADDEERPVKARRKADDDEDVFADA